MESIMNITAEELGTLCEDGACLYSSDNRE